MFMLYLFTGPISWDPEVWQEHRWYVGLHLRDIRYGHNQGK